MTERQTARECSCTGHVVYNRLYANNMPAYSSIVRTRGCTLVRARHVNVHVREHVGAHSV